MTILLILPILKVKKQNAINSIVKYRCKKTYMYEIPKKFGEIILNTFMLT